jgi:hypothetical protein
MPELLAEIIPAVVAVAEDIMVVAVQEVSIKLEEVVQVIRAGYTQ